jgi:ATP-dependent DNA helicase RecQ
VQNTLAERDQFVVLPTGAGKTLCYVVPTLAAGFRTLIFSPLVALIKDQTEGLLRMGQAAGGVSSLYSKGENTRTLNEWKRGDLDFLIVAPERLKNEEFLQALRVTPPDMIVVDEIHVASEHAFNFRPDYRKIAPAIAELNPRVFLGLTATFTSEVEEDLRTIFCLPDAVKTSAYYERTNLKMESKDGSGNVRLLRDINSIEGSVIVYFSTVKRLESTFQEIGSSVTGGACMYHGSMTPNNKDTNQTMFMNGSVRVVFATISFGMGVDKADIRGVLQVTVPGSIEELIQGFGRGGRDGKDCRCIYYMDTSSLATQEFFLDMGYPNKCYINAFYRVVKEQSDSDGNCNLRVSDICRLGSIPNQYAAAISSILASEGILERGKSEKPLRVKPLETPKTKAQQRYLEGVTEYGVRDPETGYYEVDLEFLSEQLSSTPGQVVRMLKTMQTSGNVVFDDPGNSNPLRVIAPIEKLDAQKLQKRRNGAHARLKEVVEFWSVPDQEKHKKLKEYFERK